MSRIFVIGLILYLIIVGINTFVVAIPKVPLVIMLTAVIIVMIVGIVKQMRERRRNG